MNDLTREARMTATFLELLAVLLTDSNMPGQAGNCMIRARTLRAALAGASETAPQPMESLNAHS